MAEKAKRFLIIGAHPDDADIRCGGSAIKWAKAGHIVKFVSMCNGDCGHYSMDREALRDRRYLETQASKNIAGLYEYQVFPDNHDCELEPSVELRKKVITLIREFNPDVVLSHRLCDYHADHRATAQLVQDAAYLTQVPLFCPDAPVPQVNPVFGCVFDAFTDPRPFRHDAAIIIDDVMDGKCRMLDCHVSQFYEWLAYEHSGGKEIIDPARLTWEEKKEHLLKHWGKRYIDAANDAREALSAMYGTEGKTAQYAESYELSPYGRKVSLEEFRELIKP